VRPSRRARVGAEVAEDPSAIRGAALKLLARREHAARELERKLLGRGYEAAAVESVLRALDSEGLLSDHRFVESFVTQRIARGQGPVRILMELRELGIDEARVERALAEAGADWFDLARRVRQKRFGKFAARTIGERAKQARFLQYRGFTADQVRAALEE